MHTRRKFLQSSAAVLACAGMGETAHAAPAPARAFGVQLYTDRKDVMLDPAKELRAIREIGYTCAETFGAEYNIGAKELRAMILDAGFALPSSHFAYADMSKRFDYAKELGAPFVVCGSTPGNVADSADGFKRAAQQFNEWGEQAQALGLHFAFHNHNSEFERFGDQTGLDILLKNTDPKLVQWQMDCYWVTQAGFDPLQMIHQYGNRLQTLHFKDRKPGVTTSVVTNKDAQHFTEAGTGTLNFPAIWKAAAAIGVKYFFVEQDTTEIPPLESLRVSYNNLKRLLA